MRFTPLATLCLLLALIYLMGATIFTQRIETDIRERSSAAILGYQPGLTVRVDGRDVTLLGSVDSAAAREQVGRTVAEMRGVRKSANRLTVQPTHYRLEATFRASGSGRNLVVAATVATEDEVVALQNWLTKKGLVDRDEFATDATVTNDLRAGAPAMENGIERIKFGLQQLTDLIEGRLIIDEQTWQLSGLARDPLHRKHIEDAVEKQRPLIEPLTINVDLDIHSVINEKCRVHLQRSVDELTIRFDTNSTALRPEYLNALRRFSQLQSHCDGQLLLEAHADQDGNAAYNLALSKQRATAVADYLRKLGTDPESIHQFAYGDVRSLASNESRQGKSVNRRVEVRFIHAHRSLPTGTNRFQTVSLPSAE